MLAILWSIKIIYFSGDDPADIRNAAIKLWVGYEGQKTSGFSGGKRTEIIVVKQAKVMDKKFCTIDQRH